MRTKQPYTLTRDKLPTAEVAYGRLAQTAYNMLDNPPVLHMLEQTNPVAAATAREVLTVLEKLKLTLGVKL